MAVEEGLEIGDGAFSTLLRLKTPEKPIATGWVENKVGGSFLCGRVRVSGKLTHSLLALVAPLMRSPINTDFG